MNLMRLIHKASKGDYPEYAEMYMKLLLNDGSILGQLENSFSVVRDFAYSLPAKLLTYREKAEKWTIKEILVHIVDDERIFSCRAMRFARNEKQNLPGFDQDDFARYSGANERSLDSIFDEYKAVRQATISLFSHLPEESLDRMGHGTGTFNDATVRALVYHIAGHELHHLNIMRKMCIEYPDSFKERLPSSTENE